MVIANIDLHGMTCKSRW